jgi:hypothetical protein
MNHAYGFERSENPQGNRNSPVCALTSLAVGSNFVMKHKFVMYIEGKGEGVGVRDSQSQLYSSRCLKLPVSATFQIHHQARRILKKKSPCTKRDLFYNVQYMSQL